MLCCSKCDAIYKLNEPVWQCKKCGSLLDVEFKQELNKEKISLNKNTLWRYRDAIPVSKDSSIVTFDEGFTPLVKDKLFGQDVWIKMDYLFPSGSFKDRGSTVLISKMKELNINDIVEDSSGNAGASISVYSAAAGINSKIFVPANTLESKLAQIELCGATLEMISGSRDDVADAALEAAESTYYASHVWNPYFFQGTKTIAFEISEQLGWRSPDAVILPIGNGSLLIGVYIGFDELYKANIINKIPKIIGIQPKNSAPVYNKLYEQEISPKPFKTTIAAGTAVSKPKRIDQIIQAIKTTDGEISTASESEIISSLKILLNKGYYIEPTAALAVAGFKEIIESKSLDKTVVIILTGHGLKAGNMQELFQKR